MTAKRISPHLWKKYSLYFSTQEQIEGSLSMEEQAIANQETDEALFDNYLYDGPPPENDHCIAILQY